MQPEPSAAWKIHIHQLAPDPDRQPVGGVFVPGELAHTHSGLPFGEDRAVEQEQERDFTVAQRMKILGGGHFEVVGTGHVQIDFGAALKTAHHHIGVRPQKGLERIAPLRESAEQLLQTFFFGPGIAAALRLDTNLAMQRNRMNRSARGLFDTQSERNRGNRGVRLRFSVQHLEIDLAHAGTPASTGRHLARNESKKASISRHASSPPSNPFQRRRTIPVSS